MYDARACGERFDTEQYFKQSSETRYDYVMCHLNGSEKMNISARACNTIVIDVFMRSAIYIIRILYLNSTTTL